MEKSELNTIIKASGIKKAFLASKLGISRQGLDYHLLGEGEVPDNYTKKILAQLPESTEKMPNRYLLLGNFYPMVKNLFCGNQKLLFQDRNFEKDPVFFDYNILPEEKKCFVVKADGDAMVNGTRKSIYDGDLVLIDTQARVYPGDVVLAIQNNNRHLIKQYHIEDDKRVKLVSFNPDYHPIVFVKSDLAAVYRVMKRSKIDDY